MNEEERYYARTSKYHYKNKIDYLSTTFFEKEETKRLLKIEKHSTYYRLLDSSLITYSKQKKYDVKVISCGNYFQVYQYMNKKLISDKSLEKEKKPVVLSEKTKSEEFGYKEIEEKNIKRSKMSLQRLIKANEEKFKVFITLTFEENMADIKQANKLLSKFLNNMKNRYFSDLCYICIPEFQKRGAIHYHLITNIDYDNLKLFSQEEKKIWDRRKSKWQIFKTCFYWKYGYSSVIKLENINIVGYLSKYMTKDIDNRLFGFRRYTYSQNLIHPTINYLDLEEIKDFILYHDMVHKSNLVYESSYLTKNFFEYDVNKEGCLYDVIYKEYKLKNE